MNAKFPIVWLTLGDREEGIYLAEANGAGDRVEHITSSLNFSDAVCHRSCAASRAMFRSVCHGTIAKEGKSSRTRLYL